MDSYSTDGTTALSLALNSTGGSVSMGTSAASTGVSLDLGSYSNSMLLPIGTTGQRPTGINGMIRYNSTTHSMETFQAGGWTTYTTASDARLKTDIKPMEDSLKMVEAMRPVTYKWDPKNPRNAGMDENKEHIGFIAQELEKVLPDVVDVAPDTYRTVHYDKIVTVAIGAIKEQQAVIEKQQKEIDALKAVAPAAVPANQPGNPPNVPSVTSATAEHDNMLLIVAIGFGVLALMGMGVSLLLFFRLQRGVQADA